MTILFKDTIIGGAFVVEVGKKGEIGAIFIDPSYQHKGFGKETMLFIENMYPTVKIWTLETPADSFKKHRFYESIGYKKTDEREDKKSNMLGFIYEKKID